MSTQHSPSRHLAEARRLLDELSDAPGDSQAKAAAAIAHSILVLAEQVAASRLILAADAAESMALQN
jgi:hypothetical protein